MLDLIRFSDNDELYILGDVIDRGSDGIEILLDIMNRNNIHMLLGNHEAMLLATLGPTTIIGAKRLWLQNGGSSTYWKMVYGINAEKRLEILRFLQTLPDHLQISVQGHPFYLVHGNAGTTQKERVWDSPDPHCNTPPLPDATVIVGHTCTCYMREPAENNNLRHHKIYYGCGWIGIDCGCGYLWAEGRLACLRLDDLKEFYV